ncbi:MAG: TolC family protein [Ignavibacteriales bacterium]|nr:TolC family protein [Ignavibacteriaceae bacterium]NLH61249.1 TolC family protein [Ignavibacteriales bacterium]HOJ17227.1 TolC family protein [Ignavibacteriaceae bacterium]HPO54416.1 TolC family protein [Ignavibacteriaceae bacterium]
MKKIVVLLVLLPLILSAQSKETSQLSLDRAIILALEKNADLKVAELEVNKSNEKVREARSGLFPKIDVSGQYQRYLDKPVIFLPPGSPFGTTLKIGSDNSFSASASFSIPLFSYTLFEAIALSSDYLALTEQSYLAAKNKVVGDVKKAFLAALLTSETRDVMRSSLVNAEENFENVKRLNSAGTLSDYDLLRAEVQVENLRPLILQMDNNHKLALEALKVAIGLDAGMDISVTGNLEDGFSSVTPKEEDVIDEFLKNNPQLAILDYQVRLNDRNITIETSSYFPTLAGFGSYQYQSQANDFKFSDYNWVKTSIIGLQLSVPIFNGFKTAAKINQAEIGLKQSQEQKRNLTEALKTQTLSILYRLQQAAIRIKGQDKTVLQAQEGFNIAKTRLENSLATQLEVNDAELALRQAKLNRLQAIYDYKIAEAELETILGRIK